MSEARDVMIKALMHERACGSPCRSGFACDCATDTDAQLAALAKTNLKIVGREPTEKMIEANWGPPSDFSERLAARAWRAMFDAAP